MPLPRDQKERPAFIPESVMKKRMETMPNSSSSSNSGSSEITKKNEPKPIATITIHKVGPIEEDPNFDPTIFGPDWRKEYLLASDDWKFDNIPEILNGKNIADYIDPDILKRLEELEREEEEFELEYENTFQKEDVGLLNEEEENTLEEIRSRKKLIVQKHRENKQTLKNRPPVPRKQEAKSTNDMKSHLEDIGINPTKALKRARSVSRSESRGRSQSISAPERKKQKMSSKSRDRSTSSVASVITPSLGFKSLKQKSQAEKKAKKSQQVRNRQAKKGEADRVILNLRPKHHFRGKRGIGKTDRRKKNTK